MTLEDRKRLKDIADAIERWAVAATGNIGDIATMLNDVAFIRRIAEEEK